MKLPYLSYMSDAFFKYSICRKNDSRCVKLRNFYIKNIIGFQIGNLRITSPEMIPQHVLQMKAVMDCVLENEDYVIDIEMENHKLDLYTRNRIEIYGADVTSQAQIKGDDYSYARKVLTIFIINDYFSESKQLIEKMSTGTGDRNHFPLGQQCHWKYFVQLPMIDKIVKEKKILNEFEALIYLIRHQNLDGIKYIEKEGIIKMVKRMKEEFEREAPALYEAAVKRQKLKTINYKAFLKSQVEEEYRRRWEKETEAKLKTIQEESERKTKAIQEEARKIIERDAQSHIDEGERQGEKNALVEMCNVILEERYEEKDNNWLLGCTVEQLKRIVKLTQGKKKHSYKDLMKTIFSVNSGAYVSGR